MGAYEKSAERFADAAKFSVVYTFEAHPDHESPRTDSTEQRIERARQLAITHSLRLPIYADPTDVDLATHFMFDHWGIAIVSSQGEVLCLIPDPFGIEGIQTLEKFFEDRVID